MDDRSQRNIESRVDRLLDRQAETVAPRACRLAYTVPKYGSYPAREDAPNTYWIVMVDGAFPTDTQGDTAATLADRQDPGDPKLTARNTREGEEHYVPQGSLIEVTWVPEGTGGVGQWWFTYSGADYPDDSSGGQLTIDVLICEPWNRCTEYIVFPQRRIYLPPGTRIDVLPNSVVPLNVCESSQDPPPSSDNIPPSDSVGDSSSGALGNPWTDGDIVWQDLVVSGKITPAGALGGYSVGFGYYNGRPFWYKFSEFGTWLIWWNPASFSGCWQISKVGDAVNFWFKYDDPTTPLGDYTPSPFAEGVAEVSIGGVP